MPDTTVTVTAGMPTTVTVTGGVADVTVDVQRGIPGLNNITTATTTPLVGFLSGNGTTVSGATAATSAATPNTLVLRDSYGGGVDFTSSDFASTTVSISNSGTTDNTDPVALYVEATGNAGIGARIRSTHSTALDVVSTSGTEHALFGDSGINRSFVARVAGAFGWFRGIYNARIQAADTLTANRTYTLPDATGTVALTDDPRFTDARTPLAHTHVVSDIVSIASHHLIGRHAGATGVAQEVHVGNGIEFQSNGIRRSALTGDITASAGDNATTLAATIAGNKTFSGTMALSSTLTVGGQTQLAATQAATDANSAMTRVLGDARYGAIGLAGTSAISITNQTTPQTIRSASLAVGLYHVRMVFSLNGTANTGTRHGYNFSGTATFRFLRSRASSATYTQVTSNPFDIGLAESATSARIEGVIDVTATGTFSMQAAQNTSHADTLSVIASNYMIITPCANGSIS